MKDLPNVHHTMGSPPRPRDTADPSRTRPVIRRSAAIRHPDLRRVLDDEQCGTIHLKLGRDDDGRPVDVLHVHGYAPREDSELVEKAIWAALGIEAGGTGETLGALSDGERSEPLAITQLLLLYHLFEQAR